jgi:hypothetical protein
MGHVGKPCSTGTELARIGETAADVLPAALAHKAPWKGGGAIISP